MKHLLFTVLGGVVGYYTAGKYLAPAGPGSVGGFSVWSAGGAAAGAWVGWYLAKKL